MKTTTTRKRPHSAQLRLLLGMGLLLTGCESNHQVLGLDAGTDTVRIDASPLSDTPAQSTDSGDAAATPDGSDSQTACTQPASGCGPGGPAVGSRMCNMVAAHNRIRCAVSPAASPPLPPVRWSEELAAHARTWAANCQQSHATDLGTLGEGENWRSWSAAGSLTDEQVVNTWAEEVVDYNYDTNTCRSGAACGHYTQLVWRSTVEIGCAVQECPNGFPEWSGGREIWFCRYRGPGNWQGQKPY